MGTHSAAGRNRPARVKYVYVAPGDADTPVNGPTVPTARKAAEISIAQRFRDVALALLGVTASVLLILGGRVADMALEWHPGQHTEQPVQAEPVTLAPRAFTTSALGTAQAVTVHAYAEDDAGWQCASQGNGKCGPGPLGRRQ